MLHLAKDDVWSGIDVIQTLQFESRVVEEIICTFDFLWSHHSLPSALYPVHGNNSSIMSEDILFEDPTGATTVYHNARQSVNKILIPLNSSPQ